jgi:hypothetical protein
MQGKRFNEKTKILEDMKRQWRWVRTKKINRRHEAVKKVTRRQDDRKTTRELN